MTRTQWLTVFGLGVANLLVLGLLGWWLRPAATLTALPTRQATLAPTTLNQPTLTPLPSTTPAALAFSLFGFGAQLVGDPPTATPTYTPTPWPTATPTPIPPTEHPALVFSFAPDAPLPLTAQIANVVGHKQQLSLSCESRAAADWAGFFGVTINELEFLSQLPTAADNPDLGFVGNVHGEWGQIPPNDYGVHARPVATLLRHYGLPALAQHGLTWAELQAEIAAGRPVIVWVTGHVNYGDTYLYTTYAGDVVRVAPYEHTVIVTGYTIDSVTIVDGPKTYTRPLAQFLASWANLDNMAIIAR